MGDPYLGFAFGTEMLILLRALSEKQTSYCSVNVYKLIHIYTGRYVGNLLNVNKLAN